MSGAVASRARADLLAVGSRGLSRVSYLLLGGLSGQVVAHGHGDVLVVR